MFTLAGSFGALSTLLYSLPSAPLAQPRVLLLGHVLAMCVSCAVMYPFGRGTEVWLQKALACSITVALMAKLGFPHPPAGALTLIFTGNFNSGKRSAVRSFGWRSVPHSAHAKRCGFLGSGPNQWSLSVLHRPATSARQGSWCSVAIGPVSNATQ